MLVSEDSTATSFTSISAGNRRVYRIAFPPALGRSTVAVINTADFTSPAMEEWMSFRTLPMPTSPDLLRTDGPESLIQPVTDHRHEERRLSQSRLKRHIAAGRKRIEIAHNKLIAG